MNDEVISEIERFVQENLLGLLNDRCHREFINLSQEDEMHFFGKYQSDPTIFHFCQDEKKLIHSIASHLNESDKSKDVCKAMEEMILGETL